MNAQDIINAWRDYKVETGETISLAEFRNLNLNKEGRHPGRPLDQCVFKDYNDGSERDPIEVLSIDKLRMRNT